MRYLGGKTKLARPIAQAIRDQVGDVLIWEPFCGGASVTEALASGGPVLASDAHGALIFMLQAAQSGWIPPKHVSEAEYAVAEHLPDADPRKAFIGFGCSFGGKWFGGYARSGEHRDYAAESYRNVRKMFPIPRTTFRQADFMQVAPHVRDMAIYADPPYAGTTKYSIRFDPAAFWTRCLEWVACGVRVFVSEFECPVEHAVIWTKQRKTCVTGKTSRVVVDQVFEVLGAQRSIRV